jgi:hypothetical protein
MLKTYEQITEAEQRSARAKEQARVYSLLLNERDSAERSLKNIEDALARPDETETALMTILESVDRIPESFTTSGNGDRGGMGLGVASGLIAKYVLRQVAGDCLTKCKRLRASLESRKPESEKRLTEARAAVAKFEAEHDAKKVRATGDVTLPRITAEGTASVR